MLNVLNDAWAKNWVMTVLALQTLVVLMAVFGYNFPKSFTVAVVGMVMTGFVLMQKGTMARGPRFESTF